MTSSSDRESTSDSNMESCSVYSPGSCSDSSMSSATTGNLNTINKLTHFNDNTVVGDKPFLIITEQPQKHFRFRYRSEMSGTHGCILGVNSGAKKTHPTVELRNHKGRVRIRCHLVQHDNDNEHPHQLQEDDCSNEISLEVDNQEVIVGFPNMSIIQTPKKDVSTLLFSKYPASLKNNPAKIREIKATCDKLAKTIHLNIVRLKFSAHDILTDKEICNPVYSDTIQNMKSVETNDLKICRMSKIIGSPSGNEDVYALVEKVNKKNIEVLFIQYDNNSKEIWRANAKFSSLDVHHQYAIVFRTPAFYNPETSIDVPVYVLLYRPSDQRYSDPIQFTYKAEHINRMTNKRKKNNSYSSLGSSSSNSIKSINELPTTVVNIDQTYKTPLVNIHGVVTAVPNTHFGLDAALFDDLNTNKSSPHFDRGHNGPLLSQATAPQPPQMNHIDAEIPCGSAEIKKLLEIGAQDEQYMYFAQNFGELSRREYYEGCSLPSDNIEDQFLLAPLANSIDFIQSSQMMVMDGIQTPKQEIKTEVEDESFETSKQNSHKKHASAAYAATYTKSHGTEVKKLVVELSQMMRNKNQINSVAAKQKLDQLMSMRLNNGDSFLHMTLCTNIIPTTKFVVHLLNTFHMRELLNIKNDNMQTILHLAILNHVANIVPFLITQGCDPSICDLDGNNALHLAVKYHFDVNVILKAITHNKLQFDLNATNNEGETALHVSVRHGRKDAASCVALLRQGAAAQSRDTERRTPLHLAAYHDGAHVHALLQYMLQDEVDAIDSRGNTALQIACSLPESNDTLKVVELLLKKKADPFFHKGNNESAWQLAQDKERIMNLIKIYCSEAEMMAVSEIKSEPEDDFESTDEGENVLQHFKQYIKELSSILDPKGAWRKLSKKLQCDSLNTLYEKADSPTTSLLNQALSFDDTLTSRSLAMTLKDIGEETAAKVILRYID